MSTTCCEGRVSLRDQEIAWNDCNPESMSEAEAMIKTAFRDGSLVAGRESQDTDFRRLDAGDPIPKEVVIAPQFAGG